MAKTAVIIADMIRDFIDPDGTLWVGESGGLILPYVAATVDRMRRAGAVIIFLCDAHAADDREFTRFPPHAVAGSRGAELVPPLAQQPGDYRVNKSRYSGFVGTTLGEVLVREGVSEVHLLGVCTSICIMETARDLDDRGYRIIVHRRGVADFDPQAHDWALERMARLYGAEIV